jgi:hypothetical protein
VQRYKNSFNIYKNNIKIYKKCDVCRSELAIFVFFPYLCSHKIDKYGKENLPNRLTPITGYFFLPCSDNDAGRSRRHHRDTVVRRGIAACAGRLRPAL